MDCKTKDLFENKSANILSFRARDNSGPFFMATSWSMPISYEPDLIAVCVGEKRLTSTYLHVIDRFTLSVPSSPEILKFVGSNSERDVSKKDKFYWNQDDLYPYSTTIGYAVCKFHRLEKFGTHFLLVGEVVKKVLIEGPIETIHERSMYSIGGRKEIYRWGEKTQGELV